MKSVKMDSLLQIKVALLAQQYSNSLDKNDKTITNKVDSTCIT
jgi:hypothetical protein